jgi:dynamin 1-like protein
VLGTQSAGKSSVLESIVGIDFLPRGDGVVTRRPLEFRLVHLHDESSKPWAVFEEAKGEKFFDFVKVRDKIIELTDKVAGAKKGIVDNPIVLTIHSYTCPDLTLIDLPGITRIPLSGSDQPQDIERITRGMAHRYVSDPRTIILCVIPANADITTSDALQMAG